MYPVRGEVFLVVGKKGIAQEIRDDAGLGKFPCHRHRQGKEQVQPRPGAQDRELLKLTYDAQGRICLRATPSLAVSHLA